MSGSSDRQRWPDAKYIAVSSTEEVDEMSGDNPQIVIDQDEADSGENAEIQDLEEGPEVEEEEEEADRDEDDNVFNDKHNGHLSEIMAGGDNVSVMSSSENVPANLHQFKAAVRVSRIVHQIAREGEVSFLSQLPDELKAELSMRVNDLDEKGLTPLHYAARYSHVEMMELLMDLGADVNKRGSDDMTPLHYAARYAKKASATALRALRMQRRASTATVSPSGPRRGSTISLGNGSPSPNISRKNSDAPDYEGNRPANANTIQFLIDHGANVNARDKYNLSALHHAAIRGNTAGIRKLLDSPDIDKEPRDVQDSTPLHLAATYNHFPLAQLLLSEGANPRAKDSDRRTPLHEACLEGNEAIVDLLLSKGREQFGEKYAQAMMKDEDDEGSTPLLLGVGSGRHEVVKLLLKNHANVNATNSARVFPVHSAARIGDMETLRILVENRAKLNARNALLQTPLFLAAQNNHPEVVIYLYRMGADLDRWDRDGVTPLTVAANEGHEEAVKVLLQLGARLDLVDKDDKSALFHAAEQNRPAVIEILLERIRGRELLELNDQYDNLPIHVASSRGNVECVKLLIDAGADMDNKNEDEQTPLHLAAMNGKKKVIELILKQGRNAVMDEDEDSNTALHLACMNKRTKAVATLLEFGADVQSRNAKKWTPLDCAAAVGSVKCAKLLLENDAPIDPMDRTKTTPLHLAAENGHEKMIALLLENGANIAQEDAYGRNMLELAILSRKRSVVRTVLQHKDWRKALRTTYTVTDSHGVPVPETPIRLLIRIYPELAGLVFDQCVTLVKSEEHDQILPKSTLIWHEGAKVTMDYEFIDDAFNLEEKTKEDGESVYFAMCPVDNKNHLKRFDEQYNSNGKVIMDNHPLMIMAQQKRRDLLRHPLCLALVRQKWKNFGRYVYYSQLSLYLLFLIFLTSYILLAPNPAESCGRANITNDTSSEKDGSSWEVYEMISQICIMCLVALHVVIEFVQLARAGKRYWQWSNLFDWIVYIFSFLLVFDITQETRDTGVRECWQWEFGAIVIVLAWLNLLGDIRQFPFIGIYVIMFFDIFKTFLKFVAVFIVFIVAFGLGFHTLLLTKEPFETTSYSLLKTTVMMIGEFEFEAIFFPKENLAFPISTTLLFILFLVIMAIIIMNLLVGLAVDDIKAVQEQAVLKRLAMQVELVLDVERLVPTFILRRLTSQFQTIERKSTRMWWNPFTDVVSSRSIVQDVTSLRPTGVDLQDVLDRQAAFEDSIKQIKTDIKSLVSDNEKIKDVVLALAEHNNVSLAGEDE